MSTYQYFVSIVFLDFYHQFSRFLRAVVTCKDLLQGIVKNTRKPMHVFNYLFFKVLITFSKIHG